MRPFRGVMWGCALVLLGTGPSTGQAAWDNIFQACCHNCRSGPAVSAYAAAPSVSAYAAPSVSYAAPAGDACCNPPPTQVCTTRYVQRCYYQPVTTYRTSYYYEPVTSYRTSYYYEPVTSYRYSCYYDPCSCSYKQVACPTTSYQLRSQCCAVQSYAQRCCQVPVTSYQQHSYYEPVTSCCTQPAPCATPCATDHAPQAVQAAPAFGQAQPAPSYAPPAPAQSYAAPAPPTQSYSSPPPPAVTEQRLTPTPAPSAPAVQEYRNGNSGNAPQYDKYYGPPNTMPPASGSSYRPVQPAPAQTAPVPPPSVKLDRIVAVPTARLEGQVVRDNNLPHGNVQLMFVSSNKWEPQQSVTANDDGRFHVSLASGNWLVYVKSTDGKSAFHSKIDVRDDETRRVTLVSR